MRSIIYIKHQIVLITICLIGFCSSAFGQRADSIRSSPFHQSTFTISFKDTVIQLPHQFIVSGSETVHLDTIRLKPVKDYILDERFGTLRLQSSVLLQMKSDSLVQHKLFIYYQAFPFTFKPKYQLRIPVIRIDTVTGEKVKIAKPTTTFSFDDLFGSNLQKSGSIVRGFTIGSNRDLSLNSGFRMQMSGNITNDIEVIAALTDENSPIQPEGTTQTLQEIDKVFVEIRGRDLSATLGDFNLSLAGNEFGRLNRKLQGAKGVANYRVGSTNGDFLISGAVARGKFTTNQIQGIDGVQGPYRLVGQNNERAIIVIAGTERVYVDGEQMTRGEINDYVVDYGNGEITFTAHRLITRASRIVVDFEYSDRQFNRNLIAAKSGTRLMNDKFAFNATFVREADDQNSPIDISLSEQDIDTLRAAGNDRMKATRMGAEYVGQGKGQYIQKDTAIYSVVNGDTTKLRIYQYAPQDTLNAVYAVTFSYVGFGGGDYNKISIGNYQFVGINRGSYAPVRFLPLPQSHMLTDFDLRTQLTDDLKITGEYAITNFDVNRFSLKDDDKNTGTAFKFGLQFMPKNIKIGETNIGSFDLTFNERFVGKRFLPIDRTNEVEFNRKWNIQDTSAVDEELREGALTYQPLQFLAISGGAGWIKRGEPFTSNRYTASLDVREEKLPKINYDLEVIKTRNTSSDLISNWTRHKGLAEYSIWKITPGVRYEGEVMKNRGTVLDTMKQGSFRFNEITPIIILNDIAHMSISAEYGWRWDDSLLVQKLQRSSTTTTQRYKWQLSEWNSLSSNFDFTIRNRRFTDEFKKRTNLDIETILLRWQTQYNPLNRGVESDWFYEVATERTAKLERVFQRVPQGTGNYVYAGDVNGNHVVDEQDFQLSRFDGDFIAVTVPSDELTPVIDLKASTRVRFSLSRIVDANNWLKKGLSFFSTETYARVEEKSTEQDTRQIYLLHFSRFLNEHTTLAGNNSFSQDINFMESNPQFSARFRLAQRRGLTQFALQSERSYNCERSIRLRWQFVKEIANQIDFVRKNDDLSASQSSNRVRNIISNTLTLDWSYRPEQRIELGFKFGVGRATNFDTTIVDLNDQSIRLVYSIEERGQIKTEFGREEALMNNTENNFPFELTNGRIVGKTWLWRISMDYRVTQFIQATLNYDGRSEGGNSPLHTARAEVRASF